MKPTNIKKIASYFACFFTLLSLPAESNSTNKTKSHPVTPPNIVVILADDLGWSDISSYGSEIPTPHLDTLAKNGLRYSQFYNSARCSPSRASLLTGVYPHQAGLGYLESRAIPESRGTHGKLHQRVVTMAEVLGSAGYYTAMAGKWHLGQSRGVPPWKRGFQKSLNFSLGAIYFANQKAPKAKSTLYLDGKPHALNDKKFGDDWYVSDLITDWGNQYIDDAVSQKKPFFLYLAHIAPHFPVMAPQADVEKFRTRYKEGWQHFREQRFAKQKRMGLIPSKAVLPKPLPEVMDWKELTDLEKARYDHMQAVYAASVSRLDRSVGNLVAHLKKTDQIDNTLIVFLSDNGSSAEGGPLGIATGKPLGGPSSRVFVGMNWATLHDTPFQYFKHFTHEGGIATPFIAHWPKGIDASLNGSIVHQPSHLIDVMATVTDITGVQYPKSFNGKTILPMEGRSLSPHFQGKKVARSEPIFFEHEGNRAVRDKKWKIVSKYHGPWQLFDMENDRTETHDLATTHPERVAKMKNQYFAWAERSFVDTFTGKRPNYGSAWRAKNSQYNDIRP